MQQLSLTAIRRVYEELAILSNEELYARLVETGVISKHKLDQKEPIGAKGVLHSKVKRTIRWHQQALKSAGIITPVKGERAVWSLAANQNGVDDSLHVCPKDIAVLGFSTDLGISVFGDSRQIFGKLDQPIQLCFSSLPYPLANARKYGNKQGKEYLDFALSIIEPIAQNLKPGGSIVLNLGNDIFQSGSPARSSYIERLYIALEDELGLHLMDRIIWHNPTKPPSPTHWCTNPEKPHHLKAAYEPIGWFTNDPHQIKANNRNVLRPNSDKMCALFDAGGDKRKTTFGDGAYRLHANSYKKRTEGTLQGNVLSITHKCPDSAIVHDAAKALDLPSHGAMFPAQLVDLFIRWLSEEGDLVVDPCSGTAKVGLAAQRLKRKWICVEQIAEYIQLQRALFLCNGEELH